MNPYLPPATGASSPPPAGGFGAPSDAAPEERAGVSETTMEAMRQTKPWVLLMGVFTLLGSGFMALAGVLMIVMSAMMPKNGPISPGMLGLVYLPMAALYVYPGIKLWKYGSSIGRLVTTRQVSDLEDALSQQKGFWKFVGILSLIVVGLYGLVFVFAIIGGIAGASRH
ncbi:MAG: hypothetical protein JST00_18005 [Deltaproteobacteria bacterium]|nr:hypothetical protein [Deltaproteobacteria bacterium]